MLTKDDVERVLLALFEPLLPHFSASGARVKLSSRAVWCGEEAEAREGFARRMGSCLSP